MKARSTKARILGLGASGVLFAALMFLGTPARTHDSTTPDAVLRAESPPIAAPGQHSARPATPVAERVPAPAAPGVSGMVIGIDPETGTIGMPTYEQMQELSNMERVRLEHSDEDLVPVYHADGSISLDLKGRFQEFATVRIDPSGKKTFHCVDGEEQAERAIRNESSPLTPAVPAAEER